MHSSDLFRIDVHAAAPSALKHPRKGWNVQVTVFYPDTLYCTHTLYIKFNLIWSDIRFNLTCSCSDL